MSQTAWATIAYIAFVLIITFAPRMGGRGVDKTPTHIYFIGSMIMFPLIGLIPGCGFFLLPLKAAWRLLAG